MPSHKSTQLAGHGLQAEGMPYVRDPRTGTWVGTCMTWEGHGLCSCGEASPVLPSNNARKRWHREVHKPEVRARGGGQV